MSNVAVFGLGKLGAVLVAVMADAGHAVRGYDPDSAAVDAINCAVPLTYEPQLSELLASNASRISATDSPLKALEHSEVVYIIVPTPSSVDGSFSNEFVNQALQKISDHLSSSSNFLTIVIASTVMPGSCREEFIPLVERLSGKSLGTDFGLVYSPEFIALGSIVNDMRFPDLVLIGESDSRSGAMVAELALSVVKNEPNVRRMSLESAEVAKIAINTFVTTKISYANMLSELCDQLPGSDIDDVTGAVGSDSRVGHRYLKAALGYGGPCFPRDNAALAIAAESRGVGAEIARATDTINTRQVSRVISLVKHHSEPNDLVAIFGLAYKAETPVTEKSQAIDIARELKKIGRNVIGFDPLVAQPSSHGDSLGFPISSDPQETVGAKVIIIVNPSLDLPATLTSDSSMTVVDLWGSVRTDELNVIRPGRQLKGLD